ISQYEPQHVTFTVPTRMTTQAKFVLGVLLGLSTFTVASLATVAYRVRRRHWLGAVQSALLRSAVGGVVGIGGWTLGALVALTAGFRLDGAFLATIAIGTPVALSVYLAWLRHDAPATGAVFVATLGGSLLGGWLGFHAVSG